MDQVPARSLRSTNPSDTGYSPSPGIERTFETADLETLLKDLESPNAYQLNKTGLARTFRAYVADVLDQYTAQYYGDEDPEFISDLAIKLSQLSILIFFVGEAARYPDPTTIEAMFDDHIEMGGEEFCSKYGILNFYRMIEDQLEDKSPPSHYEQLAAHLEPGDPELGRRRIDQAIIDGERAIAALGNRYQLLSDLAWCLYIAAIIVLTPTIFDILDAWLTPDDLNLLNRFIHLPRYTAFVAIAAIVVSALIGFGIVNKRPSTRLPPPPPAIRAWLDAKDKSPSLDYWREIHWHPVKYDTNCRRIKGYRFWRKSLAPRHVYEARLAKLSRNPLGLPARAYQAKRLQSYLAGTTSQFP